MVFNFFVEILDIFFYDKIARLDETFRAILSVDKYFS